MYRVTNPFREIEDNRPVKYTAGQDVSHLPAERLKELQDQDLVEEIEEEKTEESKPKKKGK